MGARFWAVAAGLGVAGCTAATDPQPEPERLGAARLALEAYCEADVQGVGVVDVETDYLPHVVACENGAATFEALRAQAISARSYLYYKLETSGSVADGTGDQVYTCGNAPNGDHALAVDTTSGVVLSYMDVTVCAFYVAGAKQMPPGCTGGTDDPTGTEKWVTYNEGLSGDGIDQTPLGFEDPSNYRNRGCMSQNGAHCLAEAGWVAEDILRFYYGEDIGFVAARGPCVLPPREPGEGGAGGEAATAGSGGAGVGGSGDGGSAGGVVALSAADANDEGGCSMTSTPRASAPWSAVVVALLAATRLSRRRVATAPRS